MFDPVPGRVFSLASDLGRVLKLDARRRALLFTVPVLAVVGVAAAWRMLIPGVAYWDNAVAAVNASTRLLGPIAAALAGWAGLRERRLDYLRGLTARSPATGPLLDLLLLTTVTLAAYGVVTIVIVGETVLRQDAGRPRLLGILAGATTLVLYVVIGYLAGRLIPHPVTVAVTAGVGWLWTVLHPKGGAWWALLPPVDLGQVGLFTEPRPGMLAHHMLWSMGLAATLTLGYAWRITRRAPLALPLTMALTVTMLSTGRLHTYDGVAVIPSPTALTCRKWPLTVCVHPALRTALPALVAEVTPLAARLTGTPGAFTRVEQRPEREPVSIRDGIARIHLDDLTPGYEKRVEKQIHAGLVDNRACSRPRGVRSAAYGSMIDAWLLDDEPWQMFGTGAGTDTGAGADTRAGAAAGTGAARRFVSWTEQQRRAWLRRHFADYRRCALTERHFR